MKPLIALVFFLFAICGLLGYSLAESDLSNPVRAEARAELLRKQAEREYEFQLATLRLEEKQVGAEIEAQLHRAKALSDMLFLLSAVLAACIVAVTAVAVYWLVQMAERQRGAVRSLPANRPANTNRPAINRDVRPGMRPNTASNVKHRKRTMAS